MLYKRRTDTAWSDAIAPDRKTGTNHLPMNLPLDVFPDTEYSQFAIRMAPGDRLLVYTDGITEASNAEGERFGIARLKNVLEKNVSAPLSALKSKVLEALSMHTNNGSIQDDVTLITMEIR